MSISSLCSGRAARLRQHFAYGTSPHRAHPATKTVAPFRVRIVPIARIPQTDGGSVLRTERTPEHRDLEGEFVGVVEFVAAGEDDQSCGVNRTDRLYALVEELRAVAPQWRSANWFAGRFEVSSRTIERDLSALQQAGVPIYATPGRRGGYAIDVQHTLPPLNLSAAEVAAVATALAADTATPFTHAGRTALQKILAVLGEVDAEGVRELASRIRLFDRADGQSRPSAVVERAIVAQQVLDITYRDKTGEASTRAVEPVAVLGVRPHWYLWAWCRLRQEPRSFRLDRITDAVKTDEAVPDRACQGFCVSGRSMVVVR